MTSTFCDTIQATLARWDKERIAEDDRQEALRHVRAQMQELAARRTEDEHRQRIYRAIEQALLDQEEPRQ